MATSNMHKPGWRSRRRSRLSLVERAVPRLGRPIEDGAKTPRIDETGAASDSKPEFASNVLATPVLKSEIGPVQFEARSLRGRGNAEPAPETPSERVSEYAPAQADDPAEANEEVRTPSSHAEAEAADVVAASPPTSEKPATPVEATTPSPPAFLAPPIQAGSETETRETDSERASIALAGIGTTSASAVAKVETGKDDSLQASEHEQSSGPKLALDWDRLIDSGFTDPRDRGRPLSRNMDEIIRALIRQALSDQSSWRDRVILVTSPYERTGKTTAAINFAFGVTTVASHHAVLVDVDTTGPGAVDRLGGHDMTGIVKALADESIGLDEVVIKTDLERLTLVASGAADDENLDRFASRRMLQILRHLTENPETILIIDAPPILLSQEAAVLSVIAGQVVLAVDAGRTTADHIEHALQRIGERHNVSLVLNECSGMTSEETPKAARRSEFPAAKRGIPSTKRRLPRAMAAAGVFMLCLLVLPTVGQTGASGAAFAGDKERSSWCALPHERCSLDADVNPVPHHRMHR